MALMDGLECSEINKSELEFSGRIDAEYYQKKFLLYQYAIKKCRILPLSKIANFLIGPFGSAYDTSAYVEQSDYRYIRGQDVKPFLLQDTSPRYMAENDYNRLNKYALNTNDILVSVVGTLGNACIIQEHEVPAIFSCKSTAVKAKDVNPFYLLSYLNSKYGKSLLCRKERGAIQKGLNLDDLRTLDIPLFSDELSKNTELLITKASNSINCAKQAYLEAEKQLETILGSATITSNKNYSIKTLAESFLKSSRLDAEYYQEKYENCIDLLDTNETVNSLCKLHDKTFLPKENTNYQYIELSNVGLTGEISDVDTIRGAELPSRARRKVKTGQIIISSIEGSLQSCALISNDFNECLCSTGFYILDSKDINPETLLVLFKSKIIQELMKQRCSGSILAGIKKDELLSMPLPKIDKKLQKDIAAKVQESFALRQQAKLLLEYAKQTVELAIEQGEDIALAWLNGIISNMEV